MTHEIKEIKLFIDEDGKGKSKRELCSVTSGSRFKTMPWFNRLNSANDADLVKAAKEQRDGWKFNGPYPNAKFILEAFDAYGKEVSFQ